MLNRSPPAHGIAVIAFQFAENKGGQDSQSTKAKERLVNSVNHFWLAKGDTGQE